MKTTPEYPSRRFFAVRMVGAWALSPDGKEAAVVTNLTGVPELWQVPVAGGWPRQRTFDGQVIGGVEYSPDGKWIAFLQDEGGTEAYQVCIVPCSGGEKRVLTSRRDRRHLGLAWSADSRKIYYCSNRENPRAFRLYGCDLKTGVETELNRNEREGDGYAVSAAAGGVLWVLGETNLRQRLFFHDPKTGEDRDLTPGSECTISHPCWIEREKRVYFLTDLDSDTHGIGSVSLGDGKFSWRKKPGKHEIQGLSLDKSGRSLAWVENRDGILETFLERGARARRLSPGAASRLGATGGIAFSEDGRSLGMIHASPVSPHELFVLSLSGRGEWRKATDSAGAAVPAKDLVVPQIVRYASDDGVQISGFLYLPKNGKKPYPLLVWPHGGPEHQETAEYRARHQFWANRGYAVFAPNFRGSTGRGRKFQRLVYRDWGGGHYRDLKAGVARLVKDGWADPERLALYGASFGGYTTLWGITQDPQLWKAAVAAVAPANLLTFLESTHASWRKSAVELIGDPETEAEFLKSRSPVFFADRVKAPLLLFQGANDPRVPRAEAEQFVAACRKAGAPVEYVCFENEGHGWRTLDRVYEEMGLAEAFLKKHLMEQAKEDLEDARGAEFVEMEESARVPR